MAQFKDSQELEEILGGFFEQMRNDPTLGPQVRDQSLQLTFHFTDPALSVTIDGVSPPTQNGPFNIYYGTPPVAAPVALTISADNANSFWQGKLNPMMALTQGQIQVEGSITNLLSLLPIAQPAVARYRDYLTEIGRSDLLV